MEKETLKAELKKLQAIKDIAHLEGVVLLKDRTKSVVVNSVELLASSYAEKTEAELRALCATLKANLELYQLISQIDNQIEAIENALKS